MKEEKNIITENKFSIKNFWQGFYAGFAIILISGIGDKLFFLNMIYASVNTFCYAFFVSLGITEFMNLINISFGELLKRYIPMPIMEYIAIGIFTIVGIWLIIKGIRMPEKKLIQNYEEEKQLLIKDKNINNENEKEENNNINNYKQIDIIENEEENKEVEEPVGVFDSWWKYFIIYFFASIGDKSQIATILITTKYNFISIFNGTVFGVAVLVFVSIVFGKSLSFSLTNKQISITCGIFFLLYSLVFFFDKKLRKNIKLNMEDNFN